MRSTTTIGIIIAHYANEQWLPGCLESLQAQSHADWEAIVVDDCTPGDRARTIVERTADPRVKYLRLERNVGPGLARNAAFDLLPHAWVFCIDPDDKLKTDCLARLLARAQEPDQPDCVICDYELWGLEMGVRSYPLCKTEELRQTQWMPGTGVLIARSRWLAGGGHSDDPVFRLGNEDWDFWIALAKTGFRPARIPLPLYRYHRLHGSLSRSLPFHDHLTRQAILRRHGDFFDAAQAREFLGDGHWRASHAHGTIGRVARTLWHASLAQRLSPRPGWWRNHTGTAFKNRFRPVARMLRKFAAASRAGLLALLAPLLGGMGYVCGRTIARRPVPLFLFFPWDLMGGADLVHLAICESVQPVRPLVIFDLSCPRPALAREFERQADVWRLGGWLRDHFAAPLTHRFLAGVIAAHDRPIVFGGNSPTFYALAPLLSKEARCVDLLHALRGGNVEPSRAIAPRLDARVIITEEIRAGLAEQYRDAGYPASLLDRVRLISNPNLLPVAGPRPSTGAGAALRVLFVGRDSPEKRTELVAAIAAVAARRIAPQPRFTAVGEIAPASLPGVDCLGLISDRSELSRVYLEHDVLLLTSSREGFPLVVTEAMNHGVVPLCTAVGGLPQLLHDGEDSFLFPADADPETIVDAMTSRLAELSADRTRWTRMSACAQNLARTWTNRAQFNSAYREVLRA